VTLFSELWPLQSLAQALHGRSNAEEEEVAAEEQDECEEAVVAKGKGIDGAVKEGERA
jgi:hypothetical protein